MQGSLAITAPSGQLTESTGKAWGVGFHVARHEDETGETKTEPDEGNVQDGFFEDDVNIAVSGRLVGVSGPPEIDPVVVKLRNRDLV